MFIFYLSYSIDFVFVFILFSFCYFTYFIYFLFIVSLNVHPVKLRSSREGSLENCKEKLYNLGGVQELF